MRIIEFSADNFKRLKIKKMSDKEIIEHDKEMICPVCDGYGYTSEHANHPHPDGDCLGECPIQVGCQNCRATGKITPPTIPQY